MAKKQPIRFTVETDGQPITKAQSDAFILNFQTALLLALLDMKLLTQAQYDQALKHVHTNNSIADITSMSGGE